MRAVLSAVLAFAREQLWMPLQREAAANGAFLYGDDVLEAPVRVANKCIEQDAPSQSVSSTTKSTGSSRSSGVRSANATTTASAKKKGKLQHQQRRARSKLALTPRGAATLRARADPAPTTASGASQPCPVRDVLSDASTCGSSDEDDERDDDDELEDLGERERRLMLERAQHIKNVTMQQSRRARRKSVTTAAAVSAAAPPAVATIETLSPASLSASSKRNRATHSVASETYAPVRLRNVTNTLWSWSVFSGFEADRLPLDARFAPCNGDNDSSHNDSSSSSSNRDDEQWLRMCTDMESRVLSFLDDNEYQ